MNWFSNSIQPLFQTKQQRREMLQHQLEETETKLTKHYNAFTYVCNDFNAPQPPLKNKVCEKIFINLLKCNSQMTKLCKQINELDE